MRETIFADLAESRGKLLQRVQQLPASGFAAPVWGVWTVKDVLGHITAWEEACVIPLRAFAAGRPFAAEAIADHDAWNALQVAKRNDWPLEEVLTELAAVRAELAQLAAGLTDEQWAARFELPWGGSGDVEEMLRGLIWHESVEHIRALN